MTLPSLLSASHYAFHGPGPHLSWTQSHQCQPWPSDIPIARVAGSLLLTPGLIQTYCLEFPVAHGTSGVQSCYHPALPCSPPLWASTPPSWSHPQLLVPSLRELPAHRAPWQPPQATWSSGTSSWGMATRQPHEAPHGHRAPVGRSARKDRTQPCWLPACPLCPLRPWLPAPDGLPHLVSIDSRVDLPPSSGNTAIPVSVGLFTTLAHIVLPEKLPTAPQTAQLFLQHTFWCYSPPDSIINEQVPRFTARYWGELMGLPQWPTLLSPAWPTLAATLGSRLPFPQGAALLLLLPGNA